MYQTPIHTMDIEKEYKIQFVDPGSKILLKKRDLDTWKQS